ncbi:TetR/AcrR family transcriptional regulator [Amycolatopsis sp. CA-230715]|uniref:TetR/AcrR family transcriptional regulator n=1 Tax=Amycolatopsis sp. CA-230715 TaxID=2745196 RepID=UPI001C0200E3|nr:TetR/AcrR family transcriptional regulator [Amycolatopsis sp. CA-230715]QWF83792.1 hypothetical protein HUW46_07235 [Amycolatopsis sp. CA-230715]
MAEESQPALGRRRRRLSDDETEKRMVDAAMALVNRTGLTVGLDHISFEDVIRDAGVARSAVYRRWPYKDLFFSDLLKALASAAVPARMPDDEGMNVIREVALEHFGWFATPRTRHDLWSELLRHAALVEFEAIHGSTDWRTYLALHATFESLASGDLRDEVQQALARSEQGFVARIAKAYEYLAGLLGYRLRPELDATFETVARLVNATMRGLVLTALSTPEVAAQRVRANPFGSSAKADWSLPALGIASTVFAFLEPDPSVAWDGERIAAVRAELSSE